jgi:hypothetical protein
MPVTVPVYSFARIPFNYWRFGEEGANCPICTILVPSVPVPTSPVDSRRVSGGVFCTDGSERMFIFLDEKAERIRTKDVHLAG